LLICYLKRRLKLRRKKKQLYFYRGINVDVDDWEVIDVLKLFSLADEVNNLDFSKGFRAFSIHSNHLNKTISIYIKQEERFLLLFKIIF